jgi:predicted TIM-barrel fold metal-dependent hydrolase
MFTIDTHTHIIAADRRRYPLASDAAVAESLESQSVSADQLLGEMDVAGVDRALLVQYFGAYRYENAYIADVALERIARFSSVCIIDLLAPDAVATLTKLIVERGVRGLRMFATEPDALWLDDPRTFPIWDRVRELQVPVIMFLRTQHLPRLRAVLERYRDVPVALDHLAEFRPPAEGDALSDELLSLSEFPNVYGKLSTVNIYRAKHSGISYAEYFGPLLERFGANRVMWGSNYPNTHDRSYPEMVALARNALGYLDPTDQELVFGGSALRLWPELAG